MTLETATRILDAHRDLSGLAAKCETSVHLIVLKFLNSAALEALRVERHNVDLPKAQAATPEVQVSA